MESDILLKRTRTAFFWTRVLSTPFFVVFTLLPYILYKDLHATLFQVTTLMVLKPTVSLLAPYWSLSVHKRPDRLVANLIWANVLKFVPFLFIPFVDNLWLFIVGSMIYLILGKGVIPAWMEVLKLNIPGETRVKVFAFGQAFDYLGIALFPILLGSILDAYHEAWRWLFPLTAMLGIGSTLFLLRIPSKAFQGAAEAGRGALATLAKPWSQSWQLLKERPDFAKFQVGFMFGGAGLMILQPAFPVFFTDTLNLSYQEMSLAIAFCKGIAFASASPFWASYFQKIDIFRFCSSVTMLAALFPLILLCAQFDIGYFYAAFLTYGIMQAGSELSWHMSGPLFSEDKDSSTFSAVNVLAQGIRGAVMPFCGLLLCTYSGAGGVFAAGSLLCLAATWQMYKASVPVRVNQSDI